MAGNGTTRAGENRKIRQEALREQLSKQKHVEHVIVISDKLADCDTELSSADVNRLKASADIKLKLINKYLPDLKAVEISADSEDGEVEAIGIVYAVKKAVGDVKVTNARTKP